MPDLALPFCIAGLASFAYRFKIWQRPSSKIFSPVAGPNVAKFDAVKVSILVPCRNEAKNIPALIKSLTAIKYDNFEIIIVDDGSTDGTYETARSHLSAFARSKVLKAPAKPANWGGKNWPCACGAAEATGDIFIFTDADTVHAPDSVNLALQYRSDHKLDLLSAVPYHRCDKWWEQGLSLFLLFPLIATAFRDRVHPRRLFAIGQYLMFTKESYVELGGHTRVASSLAEDIDLARLWMKQGQSYGVYSDPGLYEVQMYSTFEDFLRGWTRLMRLGLPRSTLLSVFEVTMVSYAFGLSLLQPRLDLLVTLGMALVMLAVIQKRFGRFSTLSLVAAPINVLLLIALTMMALFEALTRKDLQWHGRSYSESSLEDFSL